MDTHRHKFSVVVWRLLPVGPGRLVPVGPGRLAPVGPGRLAPVGPGRLVPVARGNQDLPPSWSPALVVRLVSVDP